MNFWWHKLQKYWHRLPFAQARRPATVERRGTIAICIPIVCLMGTVVAFALLRQRTIAAQAYVDNASQALVKSQGVLVSLLNAETAVRGYYITRQRLFLEPYRMAAADLEPTLTTLERLVASSPARAQTARQIAIAARERMKLLQNRINEIDTDNTGDFDGVSRKLERGKQAMDDFRALVGRFEANERRLLELRSQALEADRQLNANVMWTGLALGGVGTVVAIRILKKLAGELRNTDNLLRDSRNLLEAIVANIVDGVAIVNSDGKIESFNAAAVAMFGYQPEEVKGWNLQETATHEGNSQQTLLFPTADLHDKSQATGEIWQAIGQRKNGEWFPVEFSLNPIVLDDDRIAIVRDISDRERAAASLREQTARALELNRSLDLSNRSLRQTNRELEQFAYITSHDLKAPLRAIASLAEWIEEDLGDDRLTDYARSQFQLLRRRVVRMQALLDSLLEYSRSGSLKSPLAKVDVRQLIDEIVRSLAPPETFTIEIMPPLPILETRQQSLRQVFFHLLDNAIRHHPSQRGTVKISARDLGEAYQFTVADDGEGIAPQFQQKIYQIFQTLKPRDVEENIGAGLAIVQKIIAAEGGKIDLQSSPGNGATFQFTWPKYAIAAQGERVEGRG